MMVKVGDIIYDSKKEPVMVIFSDEEKELIKNMGDQTRFCSFPESITEVKIKDFMHIEQNI